MNTTLLIDGQNLLVRSIFGGKNSGMSVGGVPTGALVLFINGLSKHIRAEEPNRVLVVWDGGTSAARTSRLPEYKASRKPVPEQDQIYRDSSGELVRGFCAKSNVPMLRISGVEADDLIAGAWAHLTPEDTDKIVILSSDKDFLQLLGPNPAGVTTEQVRLSSYGTPTDRWDEARFIDVYGYTPAQWPLVTALAGDTSDGVPGLSGIGPKRAPKLLKAAGWDLDGVLKEYPAQADLVRACLYCVDLRSMGERLIPVPVPRWRPTRPDSALWPSLVGFLDAYELRDIKDRLHSRALWSDHDVITEPQNVPTGGQTVHQ